MITKISILRKSLSWEQNPRTDFLNSATTEIGRNAEFYNRSANLITFLAEYPDSKIEIAINLHFPPDSFSVTPKTKTMRTYYVAGGLYIHETDKD